MDIKSNEIILRHLKGIINELEKDLKREKQRKRINEIEKDLKRKRRLAEIKFYENQFDKKRIKSDGTKPIVKL